MRQEHGTTGWHDRPSGRAHPRPARRDKGAEITVRKVIPSAATPYSGHLIPVFKAAGGTKTTMVAVAARRCAGLSTMTPNPSKVFQFETQLPLYS